MQGVTTIIGGNCGASLAPLAADSAIDAIRKWADPRDININWSTFEEFLREIEKMRLGANFGSFVGYGTLRRGVIGNDARILNEEEREKVKYLLENALNEGAFGLSLGLSYGHERISPTEEIIEISKPLREGRGILKVHLRSEGTALLASINEMVRIARETGIAIQISHLKAIGKKAWPSLARALELLEKTRGDGVNINFDVSPYRTTGSLLYLLIPPGARQGGFKELFRRIDSPRDHEKIILAMREHTLHYDKILITAAKVKNVVGRTIAEIAERAGISPEETLLETVRANEGRVSIIGKTVSSQNTRLAIKNRNAIVASDGAGMAQEVKDMGNLEHPRSFGAFPRFWWHFVTNEFGITPEDAVQKISSWPAQTLGIPERGLLKKGYYADLVLFDPRLIRDRATYKNPFRYPAGISWVIVNGKVSVENGRFMEERAGKILKKAL